jgi:Thrombospondin type 3 repeat
MRALGRGVKLAVLLGLPVLGLHGRAEAQPAPPYDPAIDVQLFEYATGPKSFFAVADADVSQKDQLALDVFFTFLTNPFTVYDVAPGTNELEGPRTRVVSSMLTAELSGAYGLTDRLQLGVTLPVVLTMTGDGLDPDTAMASADGLSVTGLGDLRAELKARLLRRGELRLAAIGGVSLPSSIGSGGSKFLGDDLPTARARLALQWSHERVALGANAGIVLRKPRQIYATEIGQQATWAVGASVRLTDRFFVVGESFGRTGLFAFDVERSPAEIEGGMRVFVTSSLAVAAGGGTGLIKGVGSPDLRVFASLGYAPDVRDSDGDGIPNGSDGCVLEPEDKDRFQDSDGCPELDNDGDRRPDATDKCPDDSEDLDGFDDEDGCPELDNDKDGIVDLEDRCPLDPEDHLPPFPSDGCSATKHDADLDELVDAIDACPSDPEDGDGFEDGDGCPDNDNDGDGVEDSADQCPLCREDKDGFEDDDGCPELDNDKDGMADAADKCPNEAETLNSVDDFDGCPDEGGIVIATYDGERILVDRAPPFDRKGLTAAGVLIVDQVALTMRQHAEVTKWLVAIAAPKQRDAEKQSKWVRAQLEKRGVSANIIDLMTAAGGARLVAVGQERIAEDAPKGCPGPEAVPRPEKTVRPTLPAKPAATSPAAPPAPSPPRR